MNYFAKLMYGSLRMNPMEQAACLAFAELFGWPEWKSQNIQFNYHLFREKDGLWYMREPTGAKLFLPDFSARDRWIVWLLEEGHKFIKTITTCGVAGDIHWEIIMIDDDEIYGETLLLGLLDGVSQAKRKEAEK